MNCKVNPKWWILRSAFSPTPWESDASMEHGIGSMVVHSWMAWLRNAETAVQTRILKSNFELVISWSHVIHKLNKSSKVKLCVSHCTTIYSRCAFDFQNVVPPSFHSNGFWWSLTWSHHACCVWSEIWQKLQRQSPRPTTCKHLLRQDAASRHLHPKNLPIWTKCIDAMTSVLEAQCFPHFCQAWPFIEHPQEWSKYKKWSKKDWLVMLQRKSGHGRPSKRLHMWLLTCLHQIHPQKSTVLFTGQSCFDTETIPFFACSVLACSCTTTMIARVPSQQRTHSTEHFWRSLPTSFANLDYCRVFLRILPNGSLVSSDSFGHSVNQVNMR